MSENVRFSQNEPRNLGSALNSTPEICILLKFRPKSLSHAQNTTTKRCHVADMSYRESKTALSEQSTDNFAQNLNGKILIPAEDGQIVLFQNVYDAVFISQGRRDIAD